MNPKLFIFFVLVCAFTIFSPTLSQSCLDQEGRPVSWWVVLKAPPNAGYSGFGYYDSNTKSGKFTYNNIHVDEDKKSPVWQTFTDLNEMDNELVAWNDGRGDYSNKSAVKFAHSKGFITYNQQSGKGVLVVHSLPTYPDFGD